MVVKPKCLQVVSKTEDFLAKVGIIHGLTTAYVHVIMLFPLNYGALLSST